MRRAGRLAAETLDMITPEVKPGVTTAYLNKLCHDFIEARGTIPAPLNYRGFPKSICTSVNHIVCHGIPSDDKRLDNEDIINTHSNVPDDFTPGATNPLSFVWEPDRTGNGCGKRWVMRYE